MKPPLPAPDLAASYDAALYEVAGAHPIRLRIGQPAPAAWLQELAAQSVTLITAWNPFSVPLEEAVNLARLARLTEAVCAEGLRYLPALGRDPSGIWTAEPGLCVLDAPHALALQWLREHEQFAAVVADAQGCRLLWHPDVTLPIAPPITLS